MTRFTTLMLALAGLLIGQCAGAAAPLGPGDAFPGFQAADQHGVPYTFEAGTRVVLIAFQMGTARAANRYLAAQPETFLDDHRAVYIANIYGMPAIGRHFALPKMRKYRQRIILADDGDLLSPFPREDGLVTVLGLDDTGVVRTVGYWNPGEALSLPQPPLRGRSAPPD